MQLTLAGFTPRPTAEPLAPATAIRGVHYLGSKLRLAARIADIVDDVVPTGDLVCDLFAGTGTVAQTLARSHPVIAVDIQEYARVLCSATLTPVALSQDLRTEFVERALERGSNGPLMDALSPLVEYEAWAADRAACGDVSPFIALVEHGALLPYLSGAPLPAEQHFANALRASISRIEQQDLTLARASIISRYFGGVFFSFKQAAALDALLDAVDSMPQAARDVFLASVLGAASDAVSTVGKQFAQPMRLITKAGVPKRALVLQALGDRTLDPIDLSRQWLDRYAHLPRPKHAARALRADYLDALDCIEGEVGGVYADPPYTRDHYSRFYHVLETMCLRDNPSIATVTIGGTRQLTRGMYRAERHQSPFCIKSLAPGAFEAMFHRLGPRGIPLVLSYSPSRPDEGGRPRVMSVDALATLASRYFADVQFVDVGVHAHNKLNTRDRNAPIFNDGETLLLCRP